MLRARSSVQLQALLLCQFRALSPALLDKASFTWCRGSRYSNQRVRRFPRNFAALSSLVSLPPGLRRLPPVTDPNCPLLHGFCDVDAEVHDIVTDAHASAQRTRSQCW
ncbi:hypothetical protein CALVIDRAFT_388606 [Calocera viscosa TUFC12733]|uniref:Secreted protein n=1 Tax=Calocera viscosa (strain TUFC12733) TaxID=1330018 RepID=A0A167GJC3_CALVF|nr:hypothetical protein CALVIDRAFT_388606 [Calocera viscosa TUFC12733]